MYSPPLLLRPGAIPSWHRPRTYLMLFSRLCFGSTSRRGAIRSDPCLLAQRIPQQAHHILLFYGCHLRRKAITVQGRKEVATRITAIVLDCFAPIPSATGRHPTERRAQRTLPDAADRRILQKLDQHATLMHGIQSHLSQHLHIELWRHITQSAIQPGNALIAREQEPTTIQVVQQQVSVHARMRQSIHKNAETPVLSGHNAALL
jgi:hypothetical protein